MVDTRKSSAKPYSQPFLTVYGSVRELTGGTKTTGNDGALGMTKN